MTITNEPTIPVRRLCFVCGQPGTLIDGHHGSSVCKNGERGAAQTELIRQFEDCVTPEDLGL